MCKLARQRHLHRIPDSLLIVALCCAALLSAGPSSMAADSTPDEDQPKVVEVFDGQPVYRFYHGGGITEPERASVPGPIYPEAARRARVQGVVVLDVLIMPDGTVGDIRPIRILPLGMTDAAIDAVRQWVFKPATLEGKPVAVQYVLTIRFQLEAPQLKPGDIDINAPGGISKASPLPTATIDLLTDLLPGRAFLMEITFTRGQVKVRGATMSRDQLTSYISLLRESGAFQEVELLDESKLKNPNYELVVFSIHANLSPAKAVSPHQG